MIQLRNKFFFAFAFLAASIFLSASLGGEFLHQHIHQHQTKSSHDDCPLYQLLVQAFLFAVALALGLQESIFESTAVSNKVLISRPQYLLPRLRAPPVSL